MYIAHMKEVVLDDFKQGIADNLNGDVLLKCTALDPRSKSMKIVENKAELLLRKNEIRSFRLNVKYGAKYGASFDQKYGKSCKILFQIRGRSRIVFVSEV